jgi:hypothetical protein
VYERSMYEGSKLLDQAKKQQSYEEMFMKVIYDDDVLCVIFVAKVISTGQSTHVWGREEQVERHSLAIHRRFVRFKSYSVRILPLYYHIVLNSTIALVHLSLSPMVEDMVSLVVTVSVNRLSSGISPCVRFLYLPIFPSCLSNKRYSTVLHTRMMQDPDE